MDNKKLFGMAALGAGIFLAFKSFAKAAGKANPFRTDPFRPDTKWRENLNFSNKVTESLTSNFITTSIL